MKRILFASLLIFCAALGFGQASQNNFAGTVGSAGISANQIATYVSGLVGYSSFTFDGTNFSTPNVNVNGSGSGTLRLFQGADPFTGTNAWDLVANPSIINSFQWMGPASNIGPGVMIITPATAPSITVTTTGSAPNKTVTGFTGFPTGLFPAGVTPACVVQDSTGTGATVLAVMASNQINSMTLTFAGNSNYTAPTVACSSMALLDVTNTPTLGVVGSSSGLINFLGSTSGAPTFGCIAACVNLTASGPLQATKFVTTGNCSSSASPAVCAASSAGTVALPTGTNPTLQVNTTAVTANSIILLTVDESLGTKLSVTCNTTLSTLVNPVVTARSGGASFTFTIGAIIATNPACVSYLILN